MYPLPSKEVGSGKERAKRQNWTKNIQKMSPKVKEILEGVRLSEEGPNAETTTCGGTSELPGARLMEFKFLLNVLLELHLKL